MALTRTIFCSGCQQEKTVTRSVNDFNPFCDECLAQQDRDKESEHRTQFYDQFKDFSDKQKLDWMLDWICKQEFSSKKPKRNRNKRIG